MSRKLEFRPGKTQRSAPERRAIDRPWLVIEALRFFGTQTNEGQRFFAWSGLDAAGLRSAAVDPDFVLGLLDYFAQNLISLERFCSGAGLDPGDVIHWNETLNARGLTSHDDL